VVSAFRRTSKGPAKPGRPRNVAATTAGTRCRDSIHAIHGHRTRLLYIDTGAERILVDPWLSGSCYWRSWWHFPPNRELLPEFFNPDILYVSHHHFDHFHYPSLRRIAKTARVLIPRFAVDVSRHELDHLGFKDVTELRHGDVVTLPSGARLASYQWAGRQRAGRRAGRRRVRRHERLQDQRAVGEADPEDVRAADVSSRATRSRRRIRTATTSPIRPTRS
jgi:hypothetical protein